MEKTFIHKTRFAAHAMLVMAILQFVFVAFEAAGVVHGTERFEYHHETVLADDQSEPSASDGESAAELGAVQDIDTCDHCCHCHGHCTHLSAPASGHVLAIAPSSARLFFDECDFSSNDIHSIHRPPIA